MKNVFFAVASLMLFLCNVNAQIIVTDDVNYSTGQSGAVLDIKSDSKGVLL